MALALPQCLENRKHRVGPRGYRSVALTGIGAAPTLEPLVRMCIAYLDRDRMLVYTMIEHFTPLVVTGH